ncbi:CinA family protein [Salinisphaera aquimarina]|uniref:CinA family protein n=1 Tax=Salinisphaera aquimarina TaxID=2094031 RepID=A0ABV7EJC5_9GAMM
MIAPFDPQQSIPALVEQLATLLPSHSQRLVTAESCTGGLIAAACTERAGSSAWFERGFVTYSNDAKQQSLGVDGALIDRHGAVSDVVVAAMLEGALAHSPAEWAVAVSGVAGPDGGSADKPVGTVFIGWMSRGGAADVVRYDFDGDRADVRKASVLAALVGLRERVDAQ